MVKVSYVLSHAMCLTPRHLGLSAFARLISRAERVHGDRTKKALRDVKKEERKAVATGKKPYFLKGSEKKRLSLEQR